MPRPYASREINNPKDTRDMQVLLQKKPKMFFNFPEDWQEWFIKHPEMLSSGDESLSLEQIRDLLYDKIVTIIRCNEGEEVENILPYVTLLILSGLEHAEVYKNIRTRSTRK